MVIASDLISFLSSTSVRFKKLCNYFTSFHALEMFDRKFLEVGQVLVTISMRIGVSTKWVMIASQCCVVVLYQWDNAPVL